MVGRGCFPRTTEARGRGDGGGNPQFQAVAARCSSRPLIRTAVFLTSADPDHVLVCPRIGSANTTRHNIVQRVWRRVAFSCARATSVEPSYKHLMRAGALEAGNRGDILFASVGRDTVVGDVVIIHPGGEDGGGAGEQGGWVCCQRRRRRTVCRRSGARSRSFHS